MISLNDIIDALAHFDVHTGFPQERSAMAGKLLGAGFSARDVAMVASHVFANTKSGAKRAAILAAVLNDHVALRARVDDLSAAEERREREEQARRDEERRIVEDDERRKKADSSSIRDVTASNPYGWSNPETKRGQDHNRPGEWNPYRQAFNFTTAGVNGDFRPHGCTRFDVLGCQPAKTKGWRPKKGATSMADPREPTRHYDSAEVALAQGIGDMGTPPSRPEAGDVYGE